MFVQQFHKQTTFKRHLLAYNNNNNNNNMFIRHIAANGWIRWIKNKYESKKEFKVQTHTGTHSDTYKHITTASVTES